jgi:(p)ppGpp synthase/HD superfamily hydrolase
MNLILQAAKWADEAHRDQIRKYNGRAYIEHPMRVAGWTAVLKQPTEIEVAAAWLHDVKEDNPRYWDDIRVFIPFGVEVIVTQLTNPSKICPKLNRAARKKMDREHLAHVSPAAKVIKMIDRYDNLCDVAEAEDDFKRVYAQESLLLVQAVRPVMFDTDLTPWCNAVEQQANKLLA